MDGGGSSGGEGALVVMGGCVMGECVSIGERGMSFLIMAS